MDIKFKKYYTNWFNWGKFPYYKMIYDNIVFAIIMNNKYANAINKDPKWIVKIVNNKKINCFEFKSLKDAQNFCKKYFDKEFW